MGPGLLIMALLRIGGGQAVELILPLLTIVNRIGN